LFKNFTITLVFEKNAFFAENWQKLAKIVIITSTPGFKSKRLHCGSNCGRFQVYPDHMLTPQFFVLTLPGSKPPAMGEKQSSFITM
jgi:hypothetical protein